MKAITILFIIFISQSFISQNIIQNNFNTDTVSDINELSQTISEELIGTWEKSKMLIDYGYRIEQINFSPPGKISYNPSLEIENSETFIGSYETTSDSIKIKFYKKSIFEFYKYKIVNDSLFLMKIETYAPDDYMLNNDTEVKVWKRVYN